MNILFGMAHLNILDGILMATLLYIVAVCIIVANVVLDYTFNNRFISKLCSLLYTICGIASGIYLIQVAIDIVSNFILKR
ncbi:hypothetical protein UT300009_30780 [Paraclostridium bifermentans]